MTSLNHKNILKTAIRTNILVILRKKKGKPILYLPPNWSIDPFYFCLKKIYSAHPLYLLCTIHHLPIPTSEVLGFELCLITYKRYEPHFISKHYQNWISPDIISRTVLQHRIFCWSWCTISPYNNIRKCFDKLMEKFSSSIKSDFAKTSNNRSDNGQEGVNVRRSLRPQRSQHAFLQFVRRSLTILTTDDMTSRWCQNKAQDGKAYSSCSWRVTHLGNMGNSH